MTNYKVTSTLPVNSISGTTYGSINSGDPMGGYNIGDGSVSNTLLVEDGAFVYPTNDYWAVYILGTSLTETINGQLRGAGAHSTGLYTQAKSTTLSIGENGSVLGADRGIYTFSNGSLNLTNKGYVSGAGIASVLLGQALTPHTSITNKITNSGTIAGNIIYNGAGDATSTTNTSIVNSSTGRISQAVIDLSNAIGTNSLNNAGYVGFDANLMSYKGSAGDDTITNAKGAIIDGDVDLGDSLKINTVTNAGTIGFGSGRASITGGAHADMVTNTGRVLGGVLLGDGVNTFINSGEVGTDAGGLSYNGLSNTNTITNNVGGHFSGNVNFGINLGGPTETFTNAGTIDGYVQAGYSADKIYNKATGIMHDLHLYSGADYVENAGNIEGTISGSSDGTIIKNSGHIAAITFSSVADHYTDTGQGYTGTNLDFGDGNDIFIGGSHNETVKDNLGQDSYTFGSGDDRFLAVYLASDAKDKVDGGAGTDVFDATAVNGSFLDINLSNSKFIHPTGAAASIFSDAPEAHTATFGSSGGATTDTVLNFENIYGSNSSVGDTLVGSDAANTIFGNDGDDNLFGLGGNDLLLGGNGNDVLVGGTGADTLGGGAGSDYFVYFSTKESGVTVASRDTISDFVHGTDHIDLSAIDADGNAANGKTAFHFLGTNQVWDHVKGALRVVETPTGQVIEGDTDGNAVADFAIFVSDNGTHTAFTVGNSFSYDIHI